MQAVILAAGKSSRFYPFNSEHKSLVTIMGKTLLSHTLESLKKSKITHVIVVVGKDSKIPGCTKAPKGLAITYVVQEIPLGMGDALLKAKKYLEEKFFLLGAYHMEIADFVDDMCALQKNGDTVVLVKKDEIIDRYGAVRLEKDRVVEVVEKPEKAAKNGFRLVAIYLLSKKFIEILEEIPTEEYHFEKALGKSAQHNAVVALTTEKPTVTLKYVWDLLSIKNYLLQHITNKKISKKASVAPDVIISGPVIIEDGATVLEGVCIKGPAYIGKGVTIGNRAILRNGVTVEEKSVIGSQMEIKDTCIFTNTTTHAGFIGDSIIGKHVKIAGGFITANVRLDRQSVQTVVQEKKIDTGLRHFGVIIGNNANIGIRVATMPGIIIGENVLIGPSTTIMKNISDNKKYYTKFQEIVEENTYGK